jgi:hypothetical protein
VKHPGSEAGDAIGEEDILETDAPIERAVANRSDALGNCDADKAAAIVKGPRSDMGDTFRDADLR